MQFVVVIIFSFLISLFFHRLHPHDQVASVSLVLITVINCGALLEQRTWIYYLEYIRLLLVCGYVSYRMEQPWWFGIALLFTAALIWPVSSAKKWYLKLLYGE